MEDEKHLWTSTAFLQYLVPLKGKKEKGNLTVKNHFLFDFQSEDVFSQGSIMQTEPLSMSNE